MVTNSLLQACSSNNNNNAECVQDDYEVLSAMIGG
jgi:hypothetical protein